MTPVRKPNSKKYLDISLDEYISRRYITKLEEARKRNLEFTLTFSQYKKLLLTKHCYYLEHELTVDYENGMTYESMPFNAFTLDRIDNSIGYTAENTVACSHMFNNIKSGMEGKINRYKLNGIFGVILKGYAKVYNDHYAEDVK